jgi:hypothetical protein
MISIQPEVRNDFLAQTGMETKIQTIQTTAYGYEDSEKEEENH